MPLGPYETFGQCESAQKKKGRSATAAKKICGMLEKQSQGRGRNLRANTFESEQDLETFLNSRKTIEIDKNSGEVTMKSFLFDPSWTANYWALDPKYIPRSLDRTFKGKPQVMYQNTGLEPLEYDDLGPIVRVVGELDHPPMNDSNINHLIAMQEPYRVGTFNEWVQHPNDGSYWGLSTIHDDGFKRKLIEEPETPFFTSPFIQMLQEQNVTEPIKDFVFLHSAVVDRPGYGVKRASVPAVCTGESKTCLLHLKRASANLAAQNGIDPTKGCPFCTYKALSKIADNIRANELDEFAKPREVLFNNNPTKRGSVNSSYHNISATLQTDKKVSGNPDFTQGTQQVMAPQPAPVESTQQQNNNSSNPTLSLEQIVNEQKQTIAKLTSEINGLRSTVTEKDHALSLAVDQNKGWQQGYKELKDQLNGIGTATKRKEVESIINNSLIYSKRSREEKNKLIDDYTNSTEWTVQKLKQSLGPAEEFAFAAQQEIAQLQQQTPQNQSPQQNQPQGINTVQYTPGVNGPQFLNTDSHPVMAGEQRADVGSPQSVPSTGTQYGGGVNRSTNGQNMFASAGIGGERPTGAQIIQKYRSLFFNREGDNGGLE